MLRVDTLRAGLFALACVPQLAAAFAYNAVNDKGELVLVDRGLPPVVWRESFISFTLDIADPALAQDTRAALDEWTQGGGSIELGTGDARADVCDHLDGTNIITFTADNCGEQFGDILALTHYQTISMAGTHYIVDTDVLVQDLAASGDRWANQSTVAANRRFDENRLCIPGPAFGTKICDFYRVILHEVGHTLGLGHPDEIGQAEAAVMNSGASNLTKPFHLALDDITGLLTLYPSARAQKPGVGGAGALPITVVNEEDDSGGGAVAVSGLFALALAAVARQRRWSLRR